LFITLDRPLWRPPQQTGDSPENKPQFSDGKNREPELPLHLQFNFVRGGVPKRELSCVPLNFSNADLGQQIHEAWNIINAHPEWTDEQDLEAAIKLGMRFGPDKKADLLRVFPLKELSSIYGPIQITEASFRVAGPKEPETSFADLHWLITAKRAGTEKTLQIMVEPFHWKIISISQ
jgi:hypothetical protein